MKEVLLAIWNSPFWDKPVSAFVVPAFVITWFIWTEYRERRELRLSREVFATGWAPVKGTMYRHRYLPWRTCRLCYTVNSPNDKFIPSVFIEIIGGSYKELTAHSFCTSYKEIENANSSDSSQAANS
ncbi:hypothetical protein pEaSNUABM22_00040 [Erwinia phage pEa_SNUABM_22]|uniref:Uncharacterized protein n=1 Tax=Erwinia phage pEa_SNUABM_22 TaxID=2869549 RepID=A0AAE9BV86_9CAUD|nr:hypothetical protein MPK63_gp040 [Erwinia phage pEa_SNUABM_22]UAW96528.1 hypothetical protein pEaSNUABM22_00040 [Erwinia phage pEa_SNUABM_22]